MLGITQAEPAIEEEEEEEEEALEGAFSMLDEENVPPASHSNVGEGGSGRRALAGKSEDSYEEEEEQAVELDEDTLRAEAARCAEEFGSNSEEAVTADMQLAMLLVGLMDWSVADEVLRSLLQRAEEGLGLAHELSLQALGTHAGVQWQLEQWEAAQHSLTRLVAAREKSLSEAEAAWKNREDGAAAQLQDAQELAAEASAELASVHVEFGEHEKAVPRYQSALTMQKAAFGELSAPVLGTLDALAASLSEAEPPIGGSELAEQALRSALPLKQALGGKTSQVVADCHNELSVLLQGRGEFEMAEEEARRALHVYRQLFGELHIFTATAVNNLALLLQAQGALPQAEVEVRKAMRVFQNVLGQAHDDSVAAMRSLVEILWEQEKIEEAAEGLASMVKQPLLAVPELGSCASSARRWRLWAVQHSQGQTGRATGRPATASGARASPAASKAADDITLALTLQADDAALAAGAAARHRLPLDGAGLRRAGLAAVAARKPGRGLPLPGRGPACANGARSRRARAANPPLQKPTRLPRAALLAREEGPRRRPHGHRRGAAAALWCLRPKWPISTAFGHPGGLAVLRAADQGRAGGRRRRGGGRRGRRGRAVQHHQRARCGAQLDGLRAAAARPRAGGARAAEQVRGHVRGSARPRPLLRRRGAAQRRAGALGPGRARGRAGQPREGLPRLRVLARCVRRPRTRSTSHPP